MVASGLLRPEIALAWYYDLPPRPRLICRLCAKSTCRLRREVKNMSEEKLDRKPAPAPYAAGTGSVPVGPDRAAFERMSYRERVAFKREDPEGYALMKAAL